MANCPTGQRHCKTWLGSEHKAKAGLGPKDQGTMLSGPGHSPVGRGSNSMPESCPQIPSHQNTQKPSQGGAGREGSIGLLGADGGNSRLQITKDGKKTTGFSASLGPDGTWVV